MAGISVTTTWSTNPRSTGPDSSLVEAAAATELTVWLMNRFGDLFLVFDDGSVHMLDVGEGDLVAGREAREDFCRRVDEGDNAKQWFMIPLVDA